MVSVGVVSFAKDRSIKGSVRKISLVARLIFRMGVAEALRVLHFSNKRAAKSLRKVLHSAVLNAQNNSGFIDISRLYVVAVDVGKSVTLRRFRARARGRGDRILKRHSNVTIKLGEVSS